ncbi:hypothetical protein ABI_25550 [Asticcacaulis biprosthecium C19]|uniref:Uncharacterized protein n=1 Tax=Asticcacaulis biprosthecium C19 TaxID=715226 RepID=F4QP84_9CAUL|nr:hypothetical protein ABI_25550 [Asticcacaulis biprosthecium C19]
MSAIEVSQKGNPRNAPLRAKLGASLQKVKADYPSFPARHFEMIQAEAKRAGFENRRGAYRAEGAKR